jgi:hypothetical protein
MDESTPKLCGGCSPTISACWKPNDARLRRGRESVWDRCDAECSPERGFYYHPSRHSAGQPIVAGWAYQFIAELNFVRESWVAPIDVERLHPAQDANEVAAEQVKAFLSLPRMRTRKSRRGPLRCSSSTLDTIL